MKISYKILLSSTFALSTNACLEVGGWFQRYTSSAGSSYQTVNLQVVDNGARVCSSDYGWRMDQDGNLSLNCAPNYIFATDGHTGWYRNPVTAFRIDLSPNAWTDWYNYVVIDTYVIDKKFFGC